jgi:hypothetical protein
MAEAEAVAELESGSDRAETPAAPEASESAPGEAADLEGISSQMAYESFPAAAKALEPGVVEECCADVVLAYQNVTRGVETVLGSGAVVVDKLPGVNLEELSMLPRLAQGLAYAALRVRREVQSASFGKLFERAQNLRRKLRKSAEALAEAGLLPDADVDEVRLQVRQDVLEDCLALAALFRRNEARISGRSPVTNFDLRDAEQLVEKLRARLGQPVDSGDGESSSLLRLIEMRDRFWTLLSQRHDVLWRCGAWLYGRGVDERVPPLPVREAMVRKPRSAPLEARRKAPEPRRGLSPPALMPVRESPSAIVPARESGRHLADLQRQQERTRFLVRFGVKVNPS